jgi:DNA invertase Pin-like site-specific DNA recombinase
MICGFSEGGIMGRNTYMTEKIIHLLREAEVELPKAVPTKEVARKLGISEQTYYRWRKACGGLPPFPSDPCMSRLFC